MVSTLTKPMHGNYRVEKVTFSSAGETLVGQLYLPANLAKPAPALPILGPFCFVKEQSPMQYATRLADEGFVTLIFDPRNHGESDGTPRRYENPLYKVADTRAAIDYLLTRSEVANNAIFALGICQGSSQMLQVAVEDERVKGLATVTGQYLDLQNKLDFLGGQEMLTERLERGQVAKASFEATGEVTYMPIVDPQRKDVGLPHKPIWAWYHGWAEYSRWENRYALMSDAEVWAFDSSVAASQLKIPYLMIHGGHSDGPNAARRHFELIPSSDKQLIWEEETSHLQYYWEPPVIDRAVNNLTQWFYRHI